MRARGLATRCADLSTSAADAVCVVGCSKSLVSWGVRLSQQQHCPGVDVSWGCVDANLAGGVIAGRRLCVTVCNYVK